MPEDLHLPMRTFLLPGIASDAELLEPQAKRLGPGLVVPPWIEPEGKHEALAHYAGRFAEGLELPADGGPYALGGVSFGGMLSLELARILDPQPACVVLISSARSGDAIPRSLWYWEKMAAILDPWWMKELSRGIAQPLTWGGGEAAASAERFRAMVGRLSPAFFQWSVEACVSWEGPGPLTEFFPPIAQIHGSDDAVVRCVPEQCDEVVEGAGHLMNLTHERTVNRFVFEAVNRRIGRR
ncbi:alpha/beta fold hydrolase [Phycisphaera mikurensis]|uniref:AB hydrolase-1 domain-containing protein n=1 Tax=Phycisphaera mikurensis (strain NBRC 102666 / KCTC 22515 / FYK2301M01) TaxID=1142394 RepID=I0IB20_PHYMF|nr:alpha/beta hydrolase [Phycisphaera mikurensis]MBB6442571.1 pimeloyl-ACP methyl ester carboxylesterase [Phycisphaera mikurensis]BAM02458.1 hypothetical protein PSMK_02990 [Phycisphaera mikurensis NBRC 102666]